MKRQITTVSTKGQLVIPSQMRNQLGIRPGTRVAVALEGDHIVLYPVSERLVEESKGMLAGGPSLSEELQQERRKADRW
jgi:AbrB family looped-hinge helix DNA binding protein